NSGEHFYTAGPAEKDNLVKAGWEYEGIGWVAPDSGTPVYRLYNPNAGDHFCNLASFERDSLVEAGWKYEGVGWQSGGSVPLYRAYNPNAVSGAHNYTTGLFEQNSLLKAGWKDEGTAWYGVSVGQNLTMNLDQVSKGNYSSIAGKWASAYGDAGEREELVITNHEVKHRFFVNYIDYTKNSYLDPISIENFQLRDNYLWGTTEDLSFSTLGSIFFVPQGVTFKNSDIGRERIVVYNLGPDMSNDMPLLPYMTYYRVG
ncbi:MAG: DUF6287 domain-containing protein, partial [Streptococcaceae bacterium]|nr:DUF6287 domain-containing protein [Streptococcaceae bacterium]